MSGTKPESIEAIERKTNTPWQDWVDWIDVRDGRTLPHPEIVKIVHEKIEKTIEKAGWWAQGITVAYEQTIGRRVPGQVADGTFEVAVSRTMPIGKEASIAAAITALEDTQQLHELGVVKVSRSTTPKREYYKLNLADGTRTIIACEDKTSGKSLLSFTQIRIARDDEKEKWREFWKVIIGNL